MKKIICFLLVGLFLATGCNRAKKEVSSSNSDSPKAEAASDQATVVDASPDVHAKSPAKTDSQLTVASSPEDVCRSFIKDLQKGEVLRAEKLLTQKSITNTRRFELNFGPKVGPGASYYVGTAQYATSKQKIAFVPCQVSNSTEEQDSFSMMLRRNATGWKIAGLLFKPDGESVNDLLSFENPDDVVQLRDMFEGTAEPPARQASNDTNLK